MTSLVFLTIWPLVFQYDLCFIKFPSIFDTFPKTKPNLFGFLKVRQSQKQIMVSSILSKNERKITILIIFFLGNTQDSVFFCSFFVRIEDIIIYFRDYLTFSEMWLLNLLKKVYASMYQPFAQFRLCVKIFFFSILTS